jgi:hypothetical protein
MDSTTLLDTLSQRFAANLPRHPGVTWEDVLARLEQRPAALATLTKMELSGGEPDVVGGKAEDGTLRFLDCVAQSPGGRRSCCYDEPARRGRKRAPPATSALGMAAEMGVELLDEAGYRWLQQYGPFDTTTSSWLLTPASIRTRGGALFGDWRYGEIFVYHNGADSYYGARGFRGALRV